MSASFSGVFNLGEGASGYAVYTPFTQCYKGHFTGDCSEDGQEIEACHPEMAPDGGLAGELGGVLVVT